jgi:hypothetical protein
MMKKAILVGLLGISSILVFPQPAAAVPKWAWQQVPTPGWDVHAVAVAPNDVPFIQAPNGTVWYLKVGNLQTPDKWILLDGVASRSLAADLDGTIWALDHDGVALQPTGVENPNFRPMPGYGWAAAKGWGSGCAKAMATSGVGPDLTEAFVTPASRSWDRYDWVIGCDDGDDSSLWVIRRTMDSGGAFHSSGWQNIASGQGATSAKVAVFTHYGPIGAVQDVWFQDSLASGGLTWIYDQNHDKVVNVPNPVTRDSVKPSPPRTKGTAITDHYARFKSSNPKSNRGWLYRWDDDTEEWVYVADDPSSKVYIDKIAHSEAYASKVGWLGGSSVWGTDNFGRLYRLYNADKPK